MKEFRTAEDLDRYAGTKAVQNAMRRNYISQHGSYAEFAEQLYVDLDEQIYALQATREMRQDDGEDRITTDILHALNIYGYTVAHDNKTGGHVDLSVRLGDHSWIGEAKKDGNFQEGFLQLSSRYVQASGNYAHDQGGLLLYLIKSPNALARMTDWRNKLTENGSVCVDCSKNPLAFYSSHVLEGSGTNFKIRSMAVALYHRPLDKSARNSASKKTASKKSTVAKKSTAPRKKASRSNKGD